MMSFGSCYLMKSFESYYCSIVNLMKSFESYYSIENLMKSFGS
jgi:hypothetical protein